MKSHFIYSGIILALLCENVLADEELKEQNQVAIVQDVQTSEDEKDSIEQRSKLQQELFEEQMPKIEQIEKNTQQTSQKSNKGNNVEDKDVKLVKTYHELEVLQRSGFVLTKKSLTDLRDNLDNAVTKIDLCESVNMNAALVSAFEFAMDKTAQTNFMSKLNNLALYLQPESKGNTRKATTTDLKTEEQVIQVLDEFIKRLGAIEDSKGDKKKAKKPQVDEIDEENASIVKGLEKQMDILDKLTVIDGLLKKELENNAKVLKKATKTVDGQVENIQKAVKAAYNDQKGIIKDLYDNITTQWNNDQKKRQNGKEQKLDTNSQITMIQEEFDETKLIQYEDSMKAQIKESPSDQVIDAVMECINKYIADADDQDLNNQQKQQVIESIIMQGIVASVQEAIASKMQIKGKPVVQNIEPIAQSIVYDIVNKIKEHQLSDSEKTQMVSFQNLVSIILGQIEEEVAKQLEDEQGNEQEQLKDQKSEQIRSVYEQLVADKLKAQNKNGAIVTFSKFVRGMMKVCQVVIARDTADEIMSKFRASTEQSLITSKSASNAQLTTTTPTAGATVGSSIAIHSGQGSTNTSFYTINKGIGGRLSVGIDLGAISAEIGAGVDITRSAIFYSLEQLLDSGQVSGLLGVLSAKQLRNTLNSRQAMQQREKELLSIFANDIEGYLNMIGKIPVSVYVEWPKLTKAGPAEEAKTISKQIDSSVLILKTAGLNVVVNDDVKTWKRPSGYMTLIENNCSPAGGLSNMDVIKFLGAEYDRTKEFVETVLGDGYDKSESNTYLQQILEYEQAIRAKEKTQDEEQQSKGRENSFLTNVLPIVIGDIRAYNTVLGILSENKSDKKSEQRKHDIESKWIPKKADAKGRLGVLKAMIATAVSLQNLVTENNPRALELFRQLHTEISRLSQLLEFSKNKSNRSATFMSQATAHNKAVTASASILIPIFGEGQLMFIRSSSQDNPIQEENGEGMEFDVTLPITPTGIVGGESMDTSLNAYHQLVNSNRAAFDYGNTFTIAKDGISLMKTGLNIPEGFANGAIAGFSGNATISVGLNRVDGNENTDPIPLPSIEDGKTEEPIIRKENKWILTTLKGVVYLSSSMDLGSYLKSPGALEYASEAGKEKVLIGTDTMGYLTARYNAFSIGLKDSKNALSPWHTLKKNQKKRLFVLLKNVNDPNSNVRYELQGIYNAILGNIDKNNKVKCEETFKEFLEACSKLNEITKTDATSTNDATPLVDSGQETDETTPLIDMDQQTNDTSNTVKPDKHGKFKFLKSKKANKESGSDIDTVFDKASAQLDKVLQLNFKYNFMVDYEKAYAIKASNN